MADLTAKRARLLTEYEQAAAAEGRLRTALVNAGVDPATVEPALAGRIDRARTRPEPTWADDPATERQIATLRRMIEHRELSDDLLDARMTKGEADKAIKALIAGTSAPTAAESAAERTVDESADPVAAVVDGVAAVDDDQRVRNIVAAAIDSNPEIAAAAASPANTYAQFADWAGRKVTDVAVAELVDLADSVDRAEFLGLAAEPGLADAARTLLTDPAGLDTFARERTEHVWDTHAAVRGVDHTADPEDATAETVRQEKLQRDLDEADAATVTDWNLRGRAAFDPSDPLAPADPAADPVAAEVLGSVRAKSKTALELKREFRMGYQQERWAFTKPIREAILTAEVVTHPAVVAAVRGRGAHELWLDNDFQQAILAQARTVEDHGDLSRAAALEDILADRFPADIDMIAVAIAIESDQAGPLPWGRDEDVATWRTFTLDHFRADPVARIALKHAIRDDRCRVLDELVETSVTAFAEAHPGLGAAITDDTLARVDAAIRQDIVPIIAAENADREQDVLTYNHGGWAITDRPNTAIRFMGGIENPQWTVTTDGGGSRRHWGADHRVALGAAFDAAGLPNPDPASERLYRPVADARRTIDTAARQLLADHENTRIIAASRLFRTDRGTSNAQYNSPVREAVDDVVGQLWQQYPDQVAALDAAGLSLREVLGDDSVAPVLRQLYAEFDGDGGLLAREFPTDVEFTSRVGSVASVTGPGGSVEVSRDRFKPGWTVDDAAFPDRTLSFQEAVTIAREQVQTQPQGTVAAELAAASVADLATEADADPVAHEQVTVPLLHNARTVDDFQLILDAAARESFHDGSDYLADLTTHTRYCFDAALMPASDALEQHRNGTATQQDVTDALRDTVERLTALDAAVDGIRREDRAAFDDPPLTALAERIHHGAERSRESLDKRLAAENRTVETLPAAEPETPGTVRSAGAADLTGTDEPRSASPAGSVEAPAAETITDRPAPAAPAAEAPLVVAQTERGEPLTSPHWRTGTLVTALRPDGSTVHLSPATAERYRAAAAEPDVRQPEVTSTAQTVAGTTPVAAAVEAPPQPESPESAAPVPVPAEPAPAPAGRNFELGTEVLAPSSPKQRARANLDALAVIRTLATEARAASESEQRILAQWSGWGGVPQIFDTAKPEFDAARTELQNLLTPEEYAAARASTVNAHYTDPAIAAAMWRAVERAGLPDGARVLEPGCGSGHFLGMAPDGVRMVGVELDPITAAIAHNLYPDQHVRNHGFEAQFAGDASFTATIGNVPFGDYPLYDDIHNPNGRNVHNHFIIKSLNLTAPGGYVAVLTSAFTSDAARPDARKDMADLADLVGAVRLPNTAHRRQAATDVMTDILVFRRREDGREMTASTRDWLDTKMRPTPDKSGNEALARINGYFAQRPTHVLGRFQVGSGMYGPGTLQVAPNERESVPLGVARVLDRIIDDALDNGQALTAAAPDRAIGSALDAPGMFTRAEQEATIPGTLRFDERTELWEQYQVRDGWVATPKKGRELNDQWQRLLAMGDTVLEIGEAARDLASVPADRQMLRDRLGRQYDDYVAKYGYINRFKWTSHATENSPEKTAANFTKLEAEWRIESARDLALERGVDPEEIGDLDLDPFDGPMPEEVRDTLMEKARTPAQGPRKNRHHLQGAISYDPRIAMVRSLELFNDETLEGVKTSIFTDDATLMTRPAESAQDIDEAIAISVDELGRVDPERMARLLDTDVPTVLEQAGTKIFPSLSDPDRYELAGEFLAGDVRSKLARARTAEAEHPDIYRGAVEALEDALPPEQDPVRIGVRPGADWVGTQFHREFLAEEFGVPIDDVEVSYAPINASWKMRIHQPRNWEDAENGFNDTWGIPGRADGVALFETIANNKAVEVQKTEEELLRQPKPRFHPQHTNDLRNRAVKLEERFVQWLWAKPERYEHLKTAYNERFNRFVTPQFDTTRRQYPGLNTEKFNPYPYQRRAIERLLHGETILLDHCVGSGKTLTITIACMEMRRLGQVKQPWVVAPNHLVDQWATEFRDAYPAAKILVGGDLDGFRDRQRFLGQTAVTDWDVVIVPESVFKMIGVTKETELEYINTRLMELREGLEFAKDGGSDHSIKEIEKAIKREEEKQRTLVQSKATDVGLTFEQSGCDFIWVDEAHYYKNLARASNSGDLSVVNGSQRASDMEMKARYLRDRAFLRNVEAGRPDAPAKAIAFATGTPMVNSISELWVMNRFLRPDLLAAAGVEHIDAWAQTFAKQRTSVEMNSTSTSLRPVSRMAEYQNLGQLSSMIDQFRDVVTEDQIPVELPQMRTGKPIVVEFELAPIVRDAMFDLDDRMAATTGKTMHIDNALKIANDGRNASLHPTLAGLPKPDPEHDRIVVAADLIWRTHSDHLDMFTPGDRYGPDVHGVFQMVFCDRGTPTAGAVGGDDLYNQLRSELVARGMNRNEVAFIHDYRSPRQKQELFADCRAGRVRVLIGSTPMLGTGVNAQRLLKQLISMDPAWTPADMRQRFGRIIRQGNVHQEVDVVNIVARGSYDAVMWQIIERKDAGAQQLRSAHVPDVLEDIGGEIALSAAQTKAAATGDPVYVQLVEQESFVGGLESEQAMIANGNASRHSAIERLDRTVQRLDAALPQLDAHAVNAEAWLAIEDRGQRTITVGGTAIADNDSESLVDALQALLRSKYIDARTVKNDKPIDMFDVGGITITGRAMKSGDALQLSVTPGGHRYIEHNKVVEAMGSATAARGIIQQVRNLVKDLPEKAASGHEQIVRASARREELAAIPDVEFAKSEELSRARYELAELKAEVNARENSPQALAARGHETDRRRSEGLYEKWTLDLNATPGHAHEEGLSQAALRAAVPERMAATSAAWAAGATEREEQRANDPWKPKSADGSRFQFGADRDSGQEGASIEWTDRAWHWVAWTGDGRIASNFEDRRDSARYAATGALEKFEKETQGADAATGRDATTTRAAEPTNDIRTTLHNQRNTSSDRDRTPPHSTEPDRDHGKDGGHSL
ncbi:putative Helicase conserved C-terminal domain protein [Rhodococcus sp. RD6.2]|nr:putative Helicase conserved C-terminal domain protein [Rhodococcus sp. RD6.2]